MIGGGAPLAGTPARRPRHGRPLPPAGARGAGAERKQKGGEECVWRSSTSIVPTRGMAFRGFVWRLPWVDISFITTGDLGNCPWADEARGPIQFFPDPVDASIETGRIRDTAREGLAYDGQFLGSNSESATSS